MIDFDKIFFRVGRGPQVFWEEIPEAKLIKKKFSHTEGATKLFVIFPPRGGELRLNYFLRRQLLTRNISLLEYEFPKAMLSANWQNTLKHFNIVRQSARQEIEKLKKEYGFEAIKIIGVSMGCVNASMVANNNRDINELFLIISGHCLAESMWQGTGTQQIRQSYESNNVSLAELKKHWYTLAPENNIDKLFVKKISVFLSRADKVIPYYCGKKLAEKIKLLNYPLFYKENKYRGHNISALSFYLNPKRFLFRK